MKSILERDRSRYEHHIAMTAALLFVLWAVVTLLTQLSHVMIPFVLALVLSLVINPLFRALLSVKKLYPKGRWDDTAREPFETDEDEDGHDGVQPQHYWCMCIRSYCAETRIRFRRARRRCMRWIEGLRCWSLMWDFFAIAFSLGLVVGTFVILGWGIGSAVSSGDIWRKYAKSERLAAIVKWLGEHNIDISTQMIIDALKGPLEKVAEGTLNIIEGVFVTCVFLFFLLVGEARNAQSSDPEDEPRRPIRLGISRDVKAAVSTYLFLKSAVSFGLAGCVGITLLALKVDLLFVCILLVFLLNFIPMVGGALSVLLPCMLCFFDNNKTDGDIAVAFIVPTSLHVVFGHLLEPGLFGNALELHPIIVMFSLMIWTAMWGMVGAILSVPLTCCLKIVLKSMAARHPYALFGFCSLEFRLPSAQELDSVRRFDGATLAETEDSLTAAHESLIMPDMP